MMNISRSDFLKFVKKKNESTNNIGKSTQYYMKIYDQFYPKKSFVSWNWAIFTWTLVGYPTFWMMYRRMYLQGVLSLIAMNRLYIIFSKVTEFIIPPVSATLTPETHSLLMEWVPAFVATGIIALLFGMFGNALYFSHIRRCFLKKKEDKKAGVSVVAPLVVAGIVLIFILILIAFMGIDQIKQLSLR